MGEDKALKTFGEQSLISYQYHRLSSLFNRVYISAKTDKFDFDAPLILDSSEIYAPTPAFLDIFEHVEEFFALSVDAPFIDREIIEKIFQEAAQYPDKDAIIAKTDFPHPLVGIYRKSILPHIHQALEMQDYKLNQILKKADTHFVQFDDEERFANLNYPADFAQALQKLQNLL